MSDSPIQHTHGHTVISYDEPRNLWTFTLRGRDYSRTSLAAAKETIDKPVPQKAKPFEKIPVWVFDWNRLPVLAEITGIAERNYRGEEVWINCGGKRSKETTLFKIFPVSTENDEKISLIIKNNEEIERLKEETDALQGKLTPLKLASED